MIKIIVTGSKGRMGSRVAETIRASGNLSLAAEVDLDESLEKVIERSDVVIDFATAQAAADHAGIAARHRKPIVIGTTGLGDAQLAAVKEASLAVPVVFAPNMSIGVNVMWKLVEVASRTFGRQFKVDIVETHHIHKQDRPSGTAKKIVDIVLQGTGRKIDEDVFFYEEETPVSEGNPEDADISVRSVRRGEVVGDHVIHFTSPGETLSIHHIASTRDIFAEGAIAAARWIIGRPAGLYGMDDVLGLK